MLTVILVHHKFVINAVEKLIELKAKNTFCTTAEIAHAIGELRQLIRLAHQTRELVLSRLDEDVRKYTRQMEEAQMRSKCSRRFLVFKRC